LSQPFWDATREHRLVVPECGGCGTRFFVPEPVCPACGSTGWSWAPSPGTGTVYSYSVVHQPPSPGFDTPFVLAAVDLDDGWTILTHVVSCPPEDVMIGSRVRVSFTALNEDITLPTFVLDT
jgi:uncharacterized OB-fold protein